MPTFVLERFNWRRVGPASWVRLPGGTPVASLEDRDRADAEAAEFGQLARLAVAHPFRCGAALAELTTLPEPVFLDWLRDGDIEPPDPDGRLPWRAWADLDSAGWTAGQFAQVWAGCDRVRFGRVRVREADPLHCVLRVDWSRETNFTHFIPEAEGGAPVALWHDRAAAESDAHDKQRLAAEEVAAAQAANGDEGLRFDPTPRRLAADPFGLRPPAEHPTEPTDSHGALHCEVAEVEAADAIPAGGTAFVVLRLGWYSEDDGETDWMLFSRDDGGGWPVIARHRRGGGGRVTAGRARPSGSADEHRRGFGVPQHVQ